MLYTSGLQSTAQTSTLLQRLTYWILSNTTGSYNLSQRCKLQRRWKRRNSEAESRAEQYSCDGNNPIQLRPFSARADQGDGNEREKPCSESPRRPSSQRRCTGRWLGGCNVCWGCEEGIQLNYIRHECIFNRAASFPDVTVSLCAWLWGGFG